MWERRNSGMFDPSFGAYYREDQLSDPRVQEHFLSKVITNLPANELLKLIESERDTALAVRTEAAAQQIIDMTPQQWTECDEHTLAEQVRSLSTSAEQAALEAIEIKAYMDGMDEGSRINLREHDQQVRQAALREAVLDCLGVADYHKQQFDSGNFQGEALRLIDIRRDECSRRAQDILALLDNPSIPSAEPK
jgi:hypothetical protein